MMKLYIYDVYIYIKRSIRRFFPRFRICELLKAELTGKQFLSKGLNFVNFVNNWPAFVQIVHSTTSRSALIKCENRDKVNF